MLGPGMILLRMIEELLPEQGRLERLVEEKYLVVRAGSSTHISQDLWQLVCCNSQITSEIRTRMRKSAQVTPELLS